jgi:L-malate glycosyltransferase
VPKARVLFVGNFFQDTRGSLPVSRIVAEKISDIAVVHLTSAIQNKYLRLIDIFFATLVKRYEYLHVDVFSGNSFFFARVAARIANWRRKRTILTLHGGALHEFYSGREQAFLELFSLANVVQSPSHFLKEFFESKGHAVEYLPNPFFSERFAFNRSHVKKHSLLWVRAFTEIYKPELAVHVMRIVTNHFPDATLTMIGPDLGKLEATRTLIHKMNLLSHITILGPVENVQLAKYYQSNEVFINTTAYESFGVALMEAGSCGMPIVSTGVGEIPFLWKHGFNILLTEDFNAEKMAQQVVQVFRDEELNRKLSLNARANAERFSWANVKPAWAKLITTS